jgi:hypothetical protein
MEKNRTFYFVSGFPNCAISKTSILKISTGKTSTVKNIGSVAKTFC